MLVQQLPKAKMRLPAKDTREKRDPIFLQSLSADILKRGIKHPLHVIPDADGFMILTGINRFLAGCEAGLEEFPCVVRTETLSRLDVLREIDSENRFRKNNSKLEEGKHFHEALGILKSQKAVAEHFGVSAVHVTRVLKIKGLAEWIQEKVYSGEICPASAYHLAKVSDEATQKELVGKLKAGILKRDSLIKVIGIHNGTVRTRKPRMVTINSNGIVLRIPASGLPSLKTMKQKLDEAIKTIEKLGLSLLSLPELMKE